MILNKSTRYLPTKRIFAIVIVCLVVLWVRTANAQTEEPSQGKIAYITMTKRFGDDVLAVMNDDGSNPHVIYEDGTGLSELNWSPDGTRFVFVSTSGWRSGICIVTLATSKKSCITSNQTGNYPLWSPDGKQILYITGLGLSDQDFYVMKPDGTGIRQITNSGKAKSRPWWSPDGKQILYAGETGQSIEIFVINADGTGKRQLSTFEDCGGCAHKDMPVWSPDGRQIAFLWGKGSTSTLSSLNSAIYVMNADGSNLHMLTPPDLSVSDPTWSPDSKQIAFVAYQANTDGSDISNVFIDTINVDGTGLKTLLQDSVYLASPTWIKGTRE